jgi:dihydrodipicolinate synthase/N-acetylneuraminate lyase
MPVMIVTGLFIPHGDAFALEAIERSLDLNPNIVAIKDDMCGDFARRLSLLAHERVAVFAGGLKVNHINMWPYGCDGYMSTYMMFRPEITHRYWQAVEAQDLVTMRQIVRDYDIPLFDHLATATGGWNAALHGALEVFGVGERWRRPPYYSLNDEEMEELRSFFDDRSLLPGQPIKKYPQ